MKTLKKCYKYIMLIAILGMVISCENDYEKDVSTLVNGQNGNSTADFTRYVALGNGLTAGVTDGTIFKSSQENSYPAMLAKRFKEAQPNMEPFNIPYVKDEVGGLKKNGKQIRDKRMRFILLDTLFTYDKGETLTEITAGIGSLAHYGNLGVPEVKAFDLLSSGYGNVQNYATGEVSPYYSYFASSPTATILNDAMAQNPTFFTLWLGDDVLSYAKNGGDSNYPITDMSSFETYINTIVSTLSANAKGVIANIPDIATIPYFTTVPYNPIPLNDSLAKMVNKQYETYHMLFTLDPLNWITSKEEKEFRQISFHAGKDNAIVVEDRELTNLLLPSLTTGSEKSNYMRQAKPSDLILLPARDLLGTLEKPSDPNSVIGVGIPLGAEYVLTKKEIEEVTSAISNYNVALTRLVNANDNIFLVDMNKKWRELSETKLIYNNIPYSGEYVMGNFFSLDGISPTMKGYAIVANEFIETINKNFGTQLLKYDPNDYPGIGLD
ncbi:MAG: hypothetical protein ACK5MD_05550 [Flavobacteriales bacterium]